MQREGRQLERAMIADAKSLRLRIFYFNVQMEKGDKNTKCIFTGEVASECVYIYIELNWISNS